MKEVLFRTNLSNVVRKMTYDNYQTIRISDSKEEECFKIYILYTNENVW